MVTPIITGLPVQVAVPLVQVAVVGADVQPFPEAVMAALENTPLAMVTVAVAPLQPPLKLLNSRVPLPEKVPPLIAVTEASVEHVPVVPFRVQVPWSVIFRPPALLALMSMPLVSIFATIAGEEAPFHTCSPAVPELAVALM